MWLAYGVAWLALGLVPMWLDTHSWADLLFYAAWLPLTLAVPRLCLGPDRKYRSRVSRAYGNFISDRDFWLFLGGIVAYIALYHAITHSSPSGPFAMAPISALFVYQGLRAFRIRRTLTA